MYIYIYICRNVQTQILAEIGFSGKSDMNKNPVLCSHICFCLTVLYNNKYGMPHVYYEMSSCFSHLKGIAL